MENSNTLHFMIVMHINDHQRTFQGGWQTQCVLNQTATVAIPSLSLKRDSRICFAEISSVERESFESRKSNETRLGSFETRQKTRRAQSFHSGYSLLEDLQLVYRSDSPSTSSSMIAVPKSSTRVTLYICSEPKAFNQAPSPHGKNVKGVRMYCLLPVFVIFCLSLFIHFFLYYFKFLKTQLRRNCQVLRTSHVPEKRYESVLAEAPLLDMFHWFPPLHTAGVSFSVLARIKLLLLDTSCTKPRRYVLHPRFTFEIYWPNQKTAKDNYN